MDTKIKVNISPWNELRIELSFPAGGEREEGTTRITTPDVGIEVPSAPTSEPYVPPPSLTAAPDAQTASYSSSHFASTIFTSTPTTGACL